MIKPQPLVLAALALLCSPAWAQVYKCPDASGRTVIQQVPCMGGQQMKVRPASGHAPAPAQAGAPAPSGAEAAGSGAAAAPMTEAERINRRTRISQLESRMIRDAKLAIAQAQDRCRSDAAAIDRQRGTARNNLAGATFLQSLATQEQALRTRCDTEERSLREDHARLLAECKALGGCSNLN